MEIRLRIFQNLVLVFVVAVMALAGCSDGGGSGSAAAGGTVQSAGTQGTSTGVITKLGSVFVNGVEFDTSSAAINMEDPNDLPVLKVGMVVTVKGTFSDSTHGKALSVNFADNLQGPIAAFDASAGTMTVMGQSITFTSTTEFDDFPTKGTCSVVPGQMVQVSGFRDPGGVIQATRIERHQPDWTQNTIVELKGTISSVPGPNLFTIGGLTVDASGLAPVPIPVPTVVTPPAVKLIAGLTGDATGLSVPTGIGVGSYVKVEGKLAMFTSTTLKATRVSSYKESDEDEGKESQRVEVEGFVKNLSGNTFMVGGTLVNARSLSLAGIANGVRVEVKGILSNGVLMASSIIIEGAVPPPATVPAAPVVSAVGGFNQATLSWNGVSGATSYNIYWSTTAGVTPATGTQIASVTSPYVQTGLTAATTYYYVVTAVNAVGESAPSAQVSATTTSAPTVPAAPIGVSAVGGANLATVSWAAVAGAASYNLYWSTTAGVTPATGTLIANVTSPYVQTGLTAATTYFYVVTAVNAVGESAPSAQVSATTVSAAVPPAPTGVAATGAAAQVTLTWNAVAGATAYNIYWATAPGVSPLTGTLIANAASPYIQTGLAASTTYYYVVTALNAAGEGAPSIEASASTAATPMPPATPTGVTAVGGTNLVTVSWPAVPGATSYNLYWSAIAGVTPATGTLIANVTSPFIHTGRAASTSYFYVLTAINAAGASAPSAQVSAVTAAPALDGAALYATNCAGCHNPLASSDVNGRTAALIQAAINGNAGGMGFLSFLTPAQVQAIATAFGF